MVVPPQGRAKVLQLLHAGHQGECRTKSFARAYVWWPHMDAVITKLVSQCQRCNEINTRTGGGSENHTVWRGGHIMPPPIDLSSCES